MKKKEIKIPFLQMVEGVVLPLGFEKKKTNEGNEYIRKNTDGCVTITPIINQYNELFFISLAFQIRINEISNVLVHINNISDEFKEEYPIIGFGINSLIKIDDNRIKVETSEELAKGLEILKTVLENETMILFEKYKTVADIDAEVNRTDLPKDSLFYGVSVQPFLGIISAFLNKNPNYNNLANNYQEKLLNANQHLKNQFERLVMYLNSGLKG